MIQKDMNYTQRNLALISLFRLGVDTRIEESNMDIRFFSFRSTSFANKQTIIPSEDRNISENISFQYPAFLPHGIKRANKVIILQHGLNERNWNKYLTWAEYLCSKTGKPVILFPIAFHMNRSPASWSNPRALQLLLESRKKKYGEDRSLSFANVALSERIGEKPFRFYSSGRQSLDDLTQLSLEIKQGTHPLFTEETQIDVFSYSIGAFLSQITFMTNPLGLFSDSKLFMFCGGGIFSSMVGESRAIMDKPAFAKLLKYYTSDFAAEKANKAVRDKGFESFRSMISPEWNQPERETFFNKLGNRIRGISLAKDKVIPYSGVVKALGTSCADKRIELLDFPFQYSHENPFPTTMQTDTTTIDASFTTVFDNASQFLA